MASETDQSQRPSPVLEYAPAPKPMSRKRLAMLIGSAATASIVTGGVIYCASPATQPGPVVMGEMAAPPVVLRPQPPATMPTMPGGIGPAPTPWQQMPTTQPADGPGKP